MKQRKTIDLFLVWLPGICLTLVIVLRFLFIISNDVALDEPFTVFFAQGDLHSLFEMLPNENNPPLFFLLMHFQVRWFGISPLSVRFLSCLFSILTALMLYKTGKTYFSQQVGFFAAALFTLSDYHQLFAHEARVYALFALLTTVSMYLFLGITSQPEKKKYIVLLALTNILLIYSHFFGFFIFLIQGLSVIILPEYRKTVMKPYMLSVIISFISYIPYFPIFFTRFFQSSVSGTWVEPPVISDLYTMVWRYLNAPVVTVAALCILTASFVKFIMKIRKGTIVWNNRNLILVIWFLAPYILMFLVSYKIPMFLDRYTVFISVGFYLLIAVALNGLASEPKFRALLMTGLIIMMAVTFHPRIDNKRRLKEAVNFISDHKGLQTSVIICPNWLEYGFSYHYNQLIFSNYNGMQSLLNKERIYPVNDISNLDTLKIKNSNQIFLFEEWASLTDPGQTVSNFLNREFRYKETFTFYENFKVHQYIK